jgi:hypothetical protein
MRKDKDAVRGRNVRRSHAKMRKTLEPQVRSASTRFKNRFRSEACRRTRQRSRRRAVAERALRRNLRPAGHFLRVASDTRRTHHFSTALAAPRPESRTCPKPIDQMLSLLQRCSGDRRPPLSRFATIWRSVRDSNPRQPDYQSGALPSELTGFGDDRFRTHVRNTESQSAIPQRTDLGTPRAAGQSAPRSLLSKRRRWESNPHKAALQAAAFPVWLRRRFAI